MNPLFAKGDSRHPIRSAAAVIASLALGSALLAGCGGGGKAEKPPQSQTNSPAPGAPGLATRTDTAASVGFDPASTYKEKCQMCHGPDGRGDGPAAAGLNPKPRNYHDKAYLSTRSDAQLEETVFNGKGAMPAWGKSGILTREQIAEMVKFVRRLGSTP